MYTQQESCQPLRPRSRAKGEEKKREERAEGGKERTGLDDGFI